MNIERIHEIAGKIRILSDLKVFSQIGVQRARNEITVANLERISSNEPYKRELVELLEAQALLVNLALADKVAEISARLEAELKGEICPRAGDEEVRFLAPVTAALGPHQGLNANWATMAWKIRGASDSVWLLDDESPDETVSLVTRQDDGSGDPVIAEIISGPVSVVLPIAISIATQVQHG